MSGSGSAWARLRTGRGLRTFAATAAGAAASAGLGAWASTPEDPHYRRLRKPPWQPPPVAFPLVWTPLYADIAVTSAAAITELDEQGRHADASMLRRTLAVNLVLNTGWSVLFWRSRRPGLSTVWCAGLAAHSALLARRVGSADPSLGAALAPYPAWCTFATALNASIARRNA